MGKRIRSHVRSNVVGYLALFVALGGTATAVTQLDPKSVRSIHIVNGQVKRPDIAANAVNSAKVAPGSLLGSDFAADQLPRGATGPQGPTGPEGPSNPNADTLDNLDSTAFALAGSEDWQPLPLVSHPSYCHFVNVGNGQNPAGYLRDRAGFIHLRGVVKAVDGTFSACGAFDLDRWVNDDLPLGYLPAHREVFTISSNNKPGRIDVNTLGQLVLEPNYPTWADAKAWFSLDGISYRCAPMGYNGCP